jgi:toxin YoeB
MKIVFSKNSWEEYTFWLRTDKRILKKINELRNDIIKNPFSGKGKPERLMYDLEGFWSRRIDREHRLVYKFENDEILILSCKYHPE